MINYIDKAEHQYAGVKAISDPEIKRFLKQLDFFGFLSDDHIQYKFLQQYKSWIIDSKNNKFTGLDKFDFAVCSNGTTESFDKFYMKHKDKRFRCFKGEYTYHMLSWRNNFKNWDYIEHDDLRENDAVVISVPFADFGGIHPEMQRVLDTCENKNIPVMIDSAYIGICRNINFDFSHPAIEEVTSSLSKTFEVSHARIGIRFSRNDNDDPLFVYHKAEYVNRISCGIGLNLMNNFSADYNIDKYLPKQLELSKEMNCDISDCVLFLLGNENYNQYKRADKWNRLCISELLGN